MNKTIIIGNIVRDPETETLPSGTTVTKFSVAVNRKRNREEADFFNCSAFGKLGSDIIGKYATKGTKVMVEGRMECSTKDKDGTKVTYWGVTVDEFEILSRKSNLNNSEQITILDAADENLPF